MQFCHLQLHWRRWRRWVVQRRQVHVVHTQLSVLERTGKWILQLTHPSIARTTHSYSYLRARTRTDVGYVGTVQQGRMRRQLRRWRAATAKLRERREEHEAVDRHYADQLRKRIFQQWMIAYDHR